MIIALLAAIIILFSVADYCFIQRKPLGEATGKPRWKAVLPHGWKQLFLYLAVPLSMMAAGAMLYFFYQVPPIYAVKRLCVIGLLWPIAESDYQEMRIPNKVILIGLLIRLLILVAEGVFYGISVWGTWANEGIAAIAAAVLCFVCILISKGSMGMGDIKLMIMMALFLGIEGMCYAMFMAVFFAFIVAVILLISKRKGRKDAIPFAPFILAGTLAAIILSGT
ncbi:MAG: prepilin peptidase [Roseburia sp.]|nr:prepilin peptidase [Roseburia sp.]